MKIDYLEIARKQIKAALDGNPAHAPVRAQLAIANALIEVAIQLQMLNASKGWGPDYQEYLEEHRQSERSEQQPDLAAPRAPGGIARMSNANIPDEELPY